MLDFVGIFDKLSKALAFDSDEVNAIVKDLALLKELFNSKMETKAPAYLSLIKSNFNDKDVHGLIDILGIKIRAKSFSKNIRKSRSVWAHLLSLGYIQRLRVDGGGWWDHAPPAPGQCGAGVPVELTSILPRA